MSTFTVLHHSQALQDVAYVICVGITNQIDEAELAVISSPPSLKDFSYFTSPDFTEVSSILDLLLATGCDAEGVDPTEAPPSQYMPPELDPYLVSWSFSLSRLFCSVLWMVLMDGSFVIHA